LAPSGPPSETLNLFRRNRLHSPNREKLRNHNPHYENSVFFSSHSATSLTSMRAISLSRCGCARMRLWGPYCMSLCTTISVASHHRHEDLPSSLFRLIQLFLPDQNPLPSEMYCALHLLFFLANLGVFPCASYVRASAFSYFPLQKCPSEPFW